METLIPQAEKHVYEVDPPVVSDAFFPVRSTIVPDYEPGGMIEEEPERGITPAHMEIVKGLRNVILGIFKETSSTDGPSLAPNELVQGVCTVPEDDEKTERSKNLKCENDRTSPNTAK